jgi:hypothetical protein
MAHAIVSLATKSRPQDRSHASQFLTSLSKNQRNALRVLLMQNTGLADLRDTLGIQKMQIVPVTEQRTAHALAGTTAKLFEWNTDAPNPDRQIEASL